MEGVEGCTTPSLDDGPLGGIDPAVRLAGAALAAVLRLDDVGAALAAVAEGGGEVLQPAKDSPWGRMGTVADPSGAVLTLTQTTGEATPDRSGSSPARPGPAPG